MWPLLPRAKTISLAGRPPVRDVRNSQRESYVWGVVDFLHVLGERECQQPDLDPVTQTDAVLVFAVSQFIETGLLVRVNALARVPLYVEIGAFSPLERVADDQRRGRHL